MRVTDINIAPQAGRSASMNTGRALLQKEKNTKLIVFEDNQFPKIKQKKKYLHCQGIAYEEGAQEQVLVLNNGQNLLCKEKT